MKKFPQTQLVAIIAIACSANVVAEEEVQDMSDPLAIYTQMGVGVTNKGLNLKVGQTYDTGVATEAGMNIFEIKGFAGDVVGWDRSSQRNNSIDSIRYRNFNVDLTNGRGTQLDVGYNLSTSANEAAQEVGTVSYSMIQALPRFGPVQLFPLAGAGAVVMNSDDTGYEFPGTFAVVGMYSKIVVTDKIWLNYNPMWMTTLSGAEMFKDYFFEADSSVLNHEFTASYQIQPRFNVRYFANWSEETSFEKGDHRVEFNYQF